MQIDPALRMLGLAAKAGKVASGEFIDRKLRKNGDGCIGYRRDRCIRQHEEEVSQHV